MNTETPFRPGRSIREKTSFIISQKEKSSTDKRTETSLILLATVVHGSQMRDNVIYLSPRISLWLRTKDMSTFLKITHRKRSSPSSNSTCLTLLRKLCDITAASLSVFREFMKITSF